MNRSPRILPVILAAFAALVAIVVFLLSKEAAAPLSRHRSTESVASQPPVPAPAPGRTTAPPAGANVDPTSVEEPPAVTLFQPPGPAKGTRLDPRSPDFRKVSSEGSKRHGRVATIDRGSFQPLIALKPGDRVRLPLMEGEVVEGVIILAVDDRGVRRIGGRLNAPRVGNFTLSANGTEVSGLIDLHRERIAYEIAQESDGRTVMVEKLRSDVLCDPIPPMEEPVAMIAEGPVAAPPILNSRPTAICQLYLDFDGETVTDPSWPNRKTGGPTIVAPPHNLSNATITAIFDRVKEDFWPFDVNVTTDVAKYNTAAVGKRMRCIITSENAAAPGAGGVAYLDSFRRAGTSYSSDIPCWVFNSSETGIAEAISHEIGHTFNLRHDGRENVPGHEEYFEGHGSGSVSWAPIMGVGYYVNVVQWSKGEYALANNQEDDLVFISSRLSQAIGGNATGYVPDDAGGTRTSATGLNGTPATGAINQIGAIERTNDVDFYTFATNGGLATLNVQGETRGNLDIALELQDANGVSVPAGNNSNPAGQLNASLTANLPQGTYYLRVTSSGAGNPLTDGYSTYASLGAYTVSGRVVGLTLNPLITSSPTANGQVGVLFNYAIKATGNPTSFGATGLPTGLVLNTNSGVISGFPQAAGTFTANISATNAFGTGSRSLSIVIAAPTFTLAQATDFESLTWTSGGDAQWVAQTGVAFDSTDAAQAGSLGNNQQSFLETSITGPATVKFRWKVSSEADADFLAFQIDGADVTSVSGAVDWSEVAQSVSEGAHVLRWVYRKNATLADGLDTAWVDTVTFESNEAPVITSAANANGTVGNAFSYTIRGTHLPGSFGVTGVLPPGLKLNPNTGVISGTPAVAGSAQVTVSATNNIGTGSQALTIDIGPTSITVAAALDNPATWTLGGDANWFAETVVTDDGVDALQAGPIGIGEQTFFQTTVTGVKTVNFRWKAECETGAELQFLVDGTKVVGLTGFTGWENPKPDPSDPSSSIVIPAGTHTIRWVFVKNAVTTLGADTAWVDRVVITTDLLPVITSAASAGGQQGLSFTYQIIATNSPDFFTAQGLPDGLQVNPNTGAITGVPTEAGPFNVTIGAGNEAGTFTANLALLIQPAPTSLGEAFDQPGRGFTNSGDEPWFAQSTVTSDNSDALQSGPAGNSENSILETDVTGPIAVSFHWKVSSEQGRDFLRFAIDGPTVAQISGEVDWQQRTFTIPSGIHRLRWTYQKDSSQAVGEDAAWLDKLVLDTATTLPGFTGSLAVTAYLGRPFSHQLTATNSPTSFGATGLPPGLTLDPATGIISGTPIEEAVSQVALTATNNAGSGNAVLELSVEPEPPGADSFANATSISGVLIRSEGTSIFATAEAGEPAHAGSAASGSVWWAWTAPLTGGVTITTIGSNFFTLLSVYSGTELAGLTPIKENRGGGGGVASSVKFNAVGGQTYLICVDGLGGARGKVVLNIGYTAAGKYSGLLLDQNGAASPGLITVTLTNKLGFTGSVALGGKKSPFKGTFAGEEFVGGISRGNLAAPMALHMRVSLAEGAQEISGTVEADGVIYDFVARLPMGKSDVPPNLPGAFTFVIEPDAIDATLPGGLGYGAVTINRTGGVKATGSLGDGTKFTTSTTLALDKSWLLFLTPYRGGGVVAARIDVEAGALFAPLSGVLTWRKTADLKAKLYSAGFATTARLKGYRYVKPATGVPILRLNLPASNLDVVFDRGDLVPEPGDFTGTLDTKNKFSGGPAKSTLTFTLATGQFTGKFFDAANKPHTFGGAVLNYTTLIDDDNPMTPPVEVISDRGVGTFFGTLQTGSIELKPVQAP